MFSVACHGAQACGQVLADAAVRPAQLIQSWLASLAEHLARYDNQAVSDALRGCGHEKALFLWPFYVFMPITLFWLALGECSWGGPAGCCGLPNSAAAGCSSASRQRHCGRGVQR